MSRIGQQPIELAAGVTVEIRQNLVTLKGPKGMLAFTLPEVLSIEEKEGKIVISPKRPDEKTKALWGTARAVIANLAHGVSSGFEKRLEVLGVGYRAALEGDTLNLSLGFSHPVKVSAPEGIQFAVEKNIITVSGIDKALVGETAASIRSLKKPEPYKGKGIRYEGEKVRRKAGKKAASSA